MLIKILKRFSKVWFVLAGLFIAGNLVAISFSEGFARVQETMSPFNVVNFIVVIITLGPGILEYLLAEHLESKKK